jgi:RES domain-containing protein
MILWRIGRHRDLSGLGGLEAAGRWHHVGHLPKNWQTQLEVTRDLGTTWLERNESVLLRVPSVIVPETANLLFNPSHKLASTFRITDVFAYPFDLRLKS